MPLMTSCHDYVKKMSLLAFYTSETCSKAIEPHQLGEMKVSHFASTKRLSLIKEFFCL